MTQQRREIAERKANEMSRQDEITRTRRAARTAGDSAATKAERLRGTLTNALKRLAKEPLAPARTSAALLALRPRAKEIVEALGRGWSANAIAEVIVTESSDGETFSAETLRNAIKRLADEFRTTQGLLATSIKRISSPAADVTPIQPASSTTHHAGFAEDPT
jgi:hypothetical protein